MLFQLYLFLLDTEKKTVLPAYKYTTLALWTVSKGKVTKGKEHAHTKMVLGM